MTNSFQFLATLIPETKQIKLATGTANLSQTHPVLIAAHAAMFDHLAEGRFVLGISAGALPADAELLGHLNEDRTRIFHEAVDALFATVDDGRALQFRSAQQPLQDFQRQDGPRRVRARHGRQAVSETLSRDRRHRGGAEFVERDVLRPQGHSSAVGELSAAAMAEIALGRLRKKGARSVGTAVTPDHWRIARTIFVADDDKVAARYAVEDASSPYRFYYFNLLRKFRVAKRLAGFKHARSAGSGGHRRLRGQSPGHPRHGQQGGR